MPVRTKRVKKGDWRTLDESWNVGFTAWFRAPAGLKVKVRYGVGVFGVDGQKVTLDGHEEKKLKANSKASLAFARLQAKTSTDCDVTYTIEIGEPNTYTL